MFCTKCGNTISPDDQFCACCGAECKTDRKVKQSGTGNEQQGFHWFTPAKERVKNEAAFDAKTKILKAVLQLMFFVGPLLAMLPFYGVDSSDINWSLQGESVSEWDVAADAVFSGKEVDYTFTTSKFLDMGNVGWPQYMAYVGVAVSLLAVILLANRKWFAGLLIAAGFLFYILFEVGMVSDYERYYNTRVVEVMKEKDPGQINIANEDNYDQQLEEAADYKAEIRAKWPKPELFKLGSYKVGFYLLIIMFCVNLCLAIFLMKLRK